MGAELLRAGGRTDRRNTDMTKLIVAVRNFANAPENCYVIQVLFVIMFILKNSLN
jgi:hypothetical protein